MTIRRISLTVLGFAGSALAALMLCVSAHSILSEPVAPAMILEPEEIQFPYAIPNTGLIIQSMTGYDGPFLEDGTDREVVNTAALSVHNTSDVLLESVKINLNWAGGIYTFSGSYLPANGTAVLLEQNAQQCQFIQFTHCAATQTTAQFPPIDNDITVTEQAMGTVILTNTTEDTICGVTIYYKTWLYTENMYIGGITYAMDIADLQPGQTVCLYPEHYAVGYSKVTCIRGFSVKGNGQ